MKPFETDMGWGVRDGETIVLEPEFGSETEAQLWIEAKEEAADMQVLPSAPARTLRGQTEIVGELARARDDILQAQMKAADVRRRINVVLEASGLAKEETTTAQGVADAAARVKELEQELRTYAIALFHEVHTKQLPGGSIREGTDIEITDRQEAIKYLQAHAPDLLKPVTWANWQSTQSWLKKQIGANAEAVAKFMAEVPTTSFYINGDLTEYLGIGIQGQDPDCTCRLVLTLPDGSTLWGGIDDCPVHGFRPGEDGDPQS